MNASAIGEAVNMSVSAVIERIKKLENSGVIKNTPSASMRKSSEMMFLLSWRSAPSSINITR